MGIKAFRTTNIPKKNKIPNLNILLFDTLSSYSIKNSIEYLRKNFICFKS